MPNPNTSNKQAFERMRRDSDPHYRQWAINWLKRRKRRNANRYKTKYNEKVQSNM